MPYTDQIIEIDTYVAISKVPSNMSNMALSEWIMFLLQEGYKMLFFEIFKRSDLIHFIMIYNELIIYRVAT